MNGKFLIATIWNIQCVEYSMGIFVRGVESLLKLAKFILDWPNLQAHRKIHIHFTMTSCHIDFENFEYKAPLSNKQLIIFLNSHQLNKRLIVTKKNAPFYSHFRINFA